MKQIVHEKISDENPSAKTQRRFRTWINATIRSKEEVVVNQEIVSTD